MFTDFKYALRLLCKSPAFTALTIVVMTCGLSFSIYTASLINTLMFKDLPFPDSGNIVVIDKTQHGSRYEQGALIDADLVAIYELNNSFEDIIFYRQFYTNITAGKTAKRIQAVEIEPGGFEFTNTLPLLGRTLKESDLHWQLPTNVVISYKLWEQYFSFDKQVIGKTMPVNFQNVTIVGVMPEGYSFPYYADIWFAYDSRHIERGRYGTVAGLAKLKSDVSLQAAQQELTNIMLQLSQKYPETNTGIGAYVETIQKQALGGQSILAIYALIGATLFVLLLTSLNVGSLLFSKTLERANETSIRRALGAPRYRLIIQMLWESIIICIISSVFALLIATWFLQLTNQTVAQISYGETLYWWVFGIDKQTIIATVIIVLSTLFVAGFLPCWKATSESFNVILNQGARGATNQHVGRLSLLLIKVEVGLATMILVVSAMFVLNTLQSNQHLHKFDEKKLLTFTLEMAYQDNYYRKHFLKSLESELEELPNIENISLASSIPGDVAWVTEVKKSGQESPSNPIQANTVFVSKDLFSVFNIDLIEGRLFDSSDMGSSQAVAVISDSLANQMWPNESAIGQTITLLTLQSTTVQVVGVIKHIDHGTPINSSAKKGGIYLINSQLNSNFNRVMVEYQGDQATLLELVRKVIYQIDATVAAFHVMPYQRMIDKNLTEVKFLSLLFSILAFIALLLTISGIYGVTANSINQRLREIGVRRALGASKIQILLYFFKKMMMQLAIGLTLGLLLAGGICYFLLKAFLVSTSLMFAIFSSVFFIIVVVIVTTVVISLMGILKNNPAYALQAQ